MEEEQWLKNHGIIKQVTAGFPHYGQNSGVTGVKVIKTSCDQ